MNSKAFEFREIWRVNVKLDSSWAKNNNVPNEFGWMDNSAVTDGEDEEAIDASSNKGQDILESDDSPHPEVTRNIQEDWLPYTRPEKILQFIK